MENLEQEYLDYEEEMDTHPKEMLAESCLFTIEGHHRGKSMAACLWDSLYSGIRKSALDEGLSPHGYEGRLDKALQLISDLTNAVNNSSNDDKPHSIWRHKDISNISWYKEASNINSDLLKGAAVTYLRRSWMQHDYIDWVILDAVLFHEAATFHEIVQSGQATGKLDWAFVSADGDILKYARNRLMMSASLFSIRYLIPSSIIAYLVINNHPYGLWVGGVYAAYMAWRIFSFPSRYVAKRKVKKEKEKLDQQVNLMTNSYLMLSEGVIHPFRLRKSLDMAFESGLGFSNFISVILDGWISKNQTLFLPFGFIPDDG